MVHREQIDHGRAQIVGRLGVPGESLAAEASLNDQARRQRILKRLRHMTVIRLRSDMSRRCVDSRNIGGHVCPLAGRYDIDDIFGLPRSLLMVQARFPVSRPFGSIRQA